MNILLDSDYNAVVSVNDIPSNVLGKEVIAIDGGRGMVNIGAGGYYESVGDMGSEGASSGGLLSNWFFVGGVTGGVFAVSIVLGIILGKKRIKKGIDIYES